MAEEKPRVPATDDLSNELNVDASMFSQKELNDIDDRIQRFLVKLKKQEEEITQKRLHGRPSKRVSILPLSIFIASFCSLLLVGIGFFTELKWLDRFADTLFVARTSTAAEAQVSDAVKELVSGIRDEKDAQIVNLFVDLINTEDAEQAALSSEVDTTDTANAADAADAANAQIAQRKEQINRDLARIQEEQGEELQLQREALQVSSEQLQSLQSQFASLSSQYDQANLQLDQYTAIVAEVDEALKDGDAARATVALTQLESFLRNPSIESNSLLDNVQNVAPVLIYSAQLNLSLQDRVQSLLNAPASGTAEDLATIEELNDRLDDLTQENEQFDTTVTGLNDRIDQLTQQNEQFNTEASGFDSRLDELGQQNEQLNLELEQTLSELERVRR